MRKEKALEPILLVDDDPQSLDSTRRILEYSGYRVETASDGQEALDRIRDSNANFAVVVTDIRMPRLDGKELFQAIRILEKKTAVILMTAFGEIEDAVWAMKGGAVDFLLKPFKRKDLLKSVEGAMKRTPVKGVSAGTNEIIGRSSLMLALKEDIARVARTQATALIQGESGTGKELVARTIHLQSDRNKKPFIAVDTASIPDGLIESELFGYEKGAFTGAEQTKVGLFESAHGGTLFLDEIGDMPLHLQVKLLRVLQDRKLRRVGSNRDHSIDVRVIAATHRDVEVLVKEGKFREDLFFRLNVVSLKVPPLRDRMEDLLELSESFVREFSEKHQKSVVGISGEAFSHLGSHNWPGNIRELSNALERAVVFTDSDTIGVKDLPAHLSRTKGDYQDLRVPIGTSIKDVEDLLIKKTLEATDGDKNMTAKILGINSRTIYRKLNSQERDS